MKYLMALLCLLTVCAKAQDTAHENIFSKIKQPLQISSYHGYECAEWSLKGHTCKLVRPKQPAAGHPWIWRARFWGHEPQTEIALLERGYHVAYCDVAELFGNNEAISIWNSFYEQLRQAGLAEKAVMEGMSRGAAYVFNWAAVNPGRVACVYVDNPVLDLKSWPAGLGAAKADSAALRHLKAAYHLATEEELKQFKGSPIDKTAEIVKGNYPVFILCADADELVLPAENTLPFEQKIKALNGRISVMHKPGFKHHPHSLPDPAPIVEFIVTAVQRSVPQ